MKKIILSLSIVLFLVSCATIPVQNPVCPQEGSWICQKSAELGVQPEQVYGWIYDAAAMAALIDIVEIKELCEYEQEVADWYVAAYPISYESLITRMVSETLKYDSEKALLIKNILKRNIWAYASPQIISEPDDIIFKKGHVAFRQDMLCY